MVFESLAKRLQKATNHRYAWFGELWPWFLFVSVAGLLIVSGIANGFLRSTFIGAFFTSSNFVWRLLLVVGWSSTIVAIPSLLLDETLAD